MWILGAKGLFILNKERTGFIPPQVLNLPDSILNAPNLNFCRGNGNVLFILAGSVIYEWGTNNIKVWARYSQPAPPTREHVMMLFSPKENIFVLMPLPDESAPEDKRIRVYRKNGSIVELEKNTGKLITNASDSKSAALVNAFSDSVSVFSPFDPQYLPVIVRYPKNYSGQTFVDEDNAYAFSLNLIYRNFISRFRPELNINNIGRVYIYQISKEILALVSAEGLLLLQQRKLVFKSIEATTGHRIRAIQKDTFGHLIFGSYSGTKYLSTKNNELRQLGIEEMYAWSILPIPNQTGRFIMQGEDRGNYIYFLKSNPDGIRVVRTRKDLGIPNRVAFNTCMAMDSQRNGFWHLTNDDCLSFYNLATDQNHTFSPRLSESEERAMITTPQGIWLAGHKGLEFFSRPDFTTHTYQNVSHHIPEQIRTLSINTLYLDSGQNLWIGTNGQGLFRYNTANGHIEQFRTQHGLAENTVFSILAEKNDQVLWLGTGKGLSRFDLKQRWFDNYYTEDGLANNEFNTGATYRAYDGTMYMGGQNGINYFHPDSFQTQVQHLKQFAVIGLKGAGHHDVIQQRIVEPEAIIQVDPSVKFIEMDFRSDDYFHTAQLQYRYRISDVVESWEYLKYSEKAIFTLLPPGKHTLEVQVRSYRGMWLPAVHYTLEVLPPWYATWWFRSLIALVIMAVLFSIYLLHIRQLRHEFSLRQQISHDLHDSLGSRIYLLRNLSHQIANPLLPEHEKQASLRRFEEIGQDTFKTIRDFIWAFDPKQDEVNHLFERMDDFAENYLSDVVEELTICCPSMPNDQKINPRSKHHLMNVYQELLTNMVKHTHCQAICIQMSIENGCVAIRITNSHTGYKNEHNDNDSSSGAGLESIRHRLAEINAQIEWKEPTTSQQFAYLKAPL